MRQFDPPGLWLGAGPGRADAGEHLPGPSPNRRARRQTLLRPQPSYFAVLALLIWLVAAWNNTTRVDFPLVLAAAALLLTLSIYVLRVREIALLSQGYLLLAQAHLGRRRV